MKSICLFASYFDSDNIPYYITVYLKELKRHFDEVYFLHSRTGLNEQSNRILSAQQVKVLSIENKGFDFGLWYQAFKLIDVNEYDQVALINDSCILFKPLDEYMNWVKTTSSDVKGMTFSQAVYPHLQSYLLILNKKAVVLLEKYFENHKIRESIEDVIQTYEIGVSKYWQQNGLTISAFMDNNGYRGEFSPYYFCLKYHLEKGIPLIKKKVIFSSYRKDELFTLARMNFKINPNYYLRKIDAYNKTLIIDLQKLKNNSEGMTSFEIFKYHTLRILIKTYRLVVRKMGFFKRVYNKGISLLDRLIGKVHLFLEKKNVVKPIVDSIYRKYENEEPVKHKYPVNYRDSDKTLFDHYTNYGTFPETVYSYQKVFVTNKGVVFKRWNNVRFSFPHSVFRETFGWLYILKQYTLVKRCYLPTHITYVLLFDFWSAANYYHWLVDSLPRLFGVKDLVAQPGFSLLLPANCPDFILRCLAHFEINEITFLKKNEYYSVDKLLLPYYLAGSGHIHPPRVFEVKQFFASKIPLEDKQDRIYVSRARQKARKVINEDEIIAVLNEFDFKIIYFEDYNFEEQLKIAGKASVMISSHGANLTNSLFMPENACVLELIRKDNPNFCYWALANASRINYYYQLCDVKGHDHLVVDISLFRENLQKMLNG